ncbi:MAG: 50S ribosomal protein L2 [Candidatus Hodarchaeales archaeon]
MGKKILVQRRGRGTPVFRSLPHRRVASAQFLSYDALNNESSPKFKLVDLIHEAGRGAPLAKYEFEGTRSIMYLPAVEGIAIGDKFEISAEAEIKVGNVLPLHSLPESTPISNIELRPGDGGAFCRSSGGGGTIVSKTGKKIGVQLSSGRIKEVHPNCRAIIGVIAAGGRREKPFLRAGKKFAWKKSKGKLGAYPRTSGVAMNHHVHPFGGGAHKSPHKPTTVSRHAPPGRKVGLIAARRTGRKRGKASKRIQS